MNKLCVLASAHRAAHTVRRGCWWAAFILTTLIADSELSACPITGRCRHPSLKLVRAAHTERRADGVGAHAAGSDFKFVQSAANTSRAVGIAVASTRRQHILVRGARATGLAHSVSDGGAGQGSKLARSAHAAVSADSVGGSCAWLELPLAHRASRAWEAPPIGCGTRRLDLKKSSAAPGRVCTDPVRRGCGGHTDILPQTTFAKPGADTVRRCCRPNHFKVICSTHGGVGTHTVRCVGRCSGLELNQRSTNRRYRAHSIAAC